MEGMIDPAGHGHAPGLRVDDRHGTVRAHEEAIGGYDQFSLRLHELERHAKVAATVGSQSPVFPHYGEDVFAVTAEIDLLPLRTRNQCSRHRKILSSRR